MAGFGITITDRSAIVALEHVAVDAPAAISRGLKLFALHVGRAVASRAPFRTGRLARSFLIPTVAGSTALLGHGVPVYGAIHEYGGDIVPVHAKALVFQVGGRWVRTQKVHIRAKHYARGGMIEAAPLGPTLIGAEIARSFVA